ncbi:hypothetical protein ASG22_15265 [Chryseobacterium sp. Leaf405]|uniref:hypothetical protein n=1 Tax=Chryseobacterium sp. Leaf405 TaxID=1736367 RepID=UPI000700702C|nr:hypothetical protein [Chryseobacterium sp. Leaf405]KQT21513.1 hypothetical protein ASG22_15265 [Chryseobacterium sp. Leaf405]
MEEVLDGFDHDYFWDSNGNDDMSSKALGAIIILINSLQEQFPNINVLGGHQEWKNNVGERDAQEEYGMNYIRFLRQKLNMKSPKETGHG